DTVIGPALLLAAAAAATPAARAGAGAAAGAPTAPNVPATAAAPATHREEVWVVAERRALAAERATASVSTLDGDALRRLPATSAAEAVAYLPGFHVLFAAPFGGGQPMEIARGFFGGGEAGYVQLRIDGAP